MFLCLCVPAVLFYQKSYLMCICVRQILYFWHVLLLSDEDGWRKTKRSRMFPVSDHRIIWVERDFFKIIKSNASALRRGIFINRLFSALKDLFVPWSSQAQGWGWQFRRISLSTFFKMGAMFPFFACNFLWLPWLFKYHGEWLDNHIHQVPLGLWDASCQVP